MEKIKSLAGELGMAVDANLPANAAAMKQQVAAEKAELETQLESTLKELEDGENA